MPRGCARDRKELPDLAEAFDVRSSRNSLALLNTGLYSPHGIQPGKTQPGASWGPLHPGLQAQTLSGQPELELGGTEGSLPRRPQGYPSSPSTCSSTLAESRVSSLVKNSGGEQNRGVSVKWTVKTPSVP